MKAVITGATKGIGRAVTIQFMQHGFDVAVCARSEKEVTELKSFLEKKFPKQQVLAVVCDVSDKKQLKSFAEKIRQSGKHVDVLVNNAGRFISGDAREAEDMALEKMMEVNLYGSYYLTQYLVKDMMKQKSGHIFNLCSVASIKAYPGGALYGISKFALDGFSKNLRHELMPYHIKVTSVYPGAVYTDSWSKSGIAEERFMPVEDIAKLIYAAYDTAPQTVVEEILIRPVKGDIREDEF